MQRPDEGLIGLRYACGEGGGKGKGGACRTQYASSTVWYVSHMRTVLQYFALRCVMDRLIGMIDPCSNAVTSITRCKHFRLTFQLNEQLLSSPWFAIFPCGPPVAVRCAYQCPSLPPRPPSTSSNLPLSPDQNAIDKDQL